MTAQIPDKLYFKIGEVAKLIDVEPHVLRFWESEFPQISPSKSRTKQRLYKKDDVQTILTIRELLYEQKFTIEGARRRLKEMKQLMKKNKKSDDSQISMEFAAEPKQEPAQQTAAALTPNNKKLVSEIRSVLKEMDQVLKDA